MALLLLFTATEAGARVRHRRARVTRHGERVGLPFVAPLPARTLQAMDQALSAAFPPHGPGAAVLVARGDRVVLRKGYGLSDLTSRILVKPEGAFRIGALGESFTAVAALQLVGDGKLGLGDSVAKWIPGFPIAITVEQLLTHTSGIPVSDLAECASSTDDVAARFASGAPDFTPDSDWRDNPADYALLARILAAASGAPFADWMQARIFGPIGLPHTACGPDGHLVSTVDDLRRWCEALERDTVVDHALLERAYTPSTLSDGRTTNYGYGFGIATLHGHATLERSVAGPGVAGAILRLRDERLTVIVLGHEGADAGRVAREIAGIAVGLPWREPGVPVPDSTQTARLAGTYHDVGHTWAITGRDGRLFAQKDQDPPIELAPHTANEFDAPAPGLTFEFRLEPGARAERLIVRRRVGPAEILTRSDTQSFN